MAAKTDREREREGPDDFKVCLVYRFCEKKIEINHGFESRNNSVIIQKNNFLIKEQNPRLFVSANFRLPKICCQSADQKKNGLAVRTPLTVAEFVMDFPRVWYFQT